MLAQGHRYFVSFFYTMFIVKTGTPFGIYYDEMSWKSVLDWIESQRNIYLRIKLTWKICLFPYFEKITQFKYEGDIPLYLLFYKNVTN